MAGDRPGRVAPDGEVSVAGELRTSLLGPAARYTPVDIAHAGGADRELTRRLWRAMGFADVPDDEVAFTDDDLTALRRAVSLMARDALDDRDVLYLARVLGQASANMAESVVSFALERVERGDGARPATSELLGELDHLVVYLLNRHLLEALRRHLGDRRDSGEGTPLCVGFADLVGYTRLSQRLDEHELAALIEGFETTAGDAVVTRGGRVVKMIGDEVMFAAEPRNGIDIALALAESFVGDDVPAVRVGLACGSVVTRAGDLFGPTVNLAARATAIARPSSVLVSADLFDVVAADPTLHLRRMRPRRLKGIGWAELGVVRRLGDGD
ncbi:MAG TPA: adenylate/guanylate cyclase domain-containing protein [Acidimicrobiales bacterium]|nr:adenylate/guanylate cyclase domain-containing protein [Acidimicrobiales bacterium]